jgi:hypothetical protein
MYRISRFIKFNKFIFELAVYHSKFTSTFSFPVESNLSNVRLANSLVGWDNLVAIVLQMLFEDGTARGWNGYFFFVGNSVSCQRRRENALAGRSKNASRGEPSRALANFAFQFD